jgi:hypothetical protein
MKLILSCLALFLAAARSSFLRSNEFRLSVAAIIKGL